MPRDGDTIFRLTFVIAGLVPSNIVDQPPLGFILERDA
jgi:hypothetical protein